MSVDALRRHVHRMPFGAQVEADGTTRFRLWAPAAREVTLELGRGAPELGHGSLELGNGAPERGDGGALREVSLAALADGWFEALVDDVGPGSRYCYRIDGDLRVPDPASRFNPDDVHGTSLVVDPAAFAWTDGHWRGRPWEDAVIYELHVGAFTPAGTFLAAIDRLDYLVDLGVTAIELMPVADFPGRRNWGYDGVLLFAPEAAYGTPDELKALVCAAHARGLMVLLDVVYNHFGPEGNYLHAYAPGFFNRGGHTPWGAAIAFDDEEQRPVREFYLHNALYWLEEFRFDGLRVDAVHAIVDRSATHIVEAIAQAVRDGPGRERAIHLVLENDTNEAARLRRDAAGRPIVATAQWNDDIHHALHVLATGEHDGYYEDYAAAPLEHLRRCLAEGFAWQGEPSPHRGGARRGQPSGALPATAFVGFLQTHDQVGNRAFGERLAHFADPRALRAAAACILHCPSPPLLFMGEEFAASSPFLFFCDFSGELAAQVREGRRREFARFTRFGDHAGGEAVPDPGAPETFARSKLRWDEIDAPGHREWLAFYRQCLAQRARWIVPRLPALLPGGSARLVRPGLVHAVWRFADAARLHLFAHFAEDRSAPLHLPAGTMVHPSVDALGRDRSAFALEACEVIVVLETAAPDASEPA